MVHESEIFKKLMSILILHFLFPDTEAFGANLTYHTPYANNEIVAGSPVTLVCIWTTSMNGIDSFSLSFKEGAMYTAVYTSRAVVNQDEYGFVDNLFGRALLQSTTGNQYRVTITEFEDRDEGDYKCTVFDNSLNTAESIQTLSFSFTGRFNAALNKYTEQSSTNRYQGDSRVSGRAVDGNRNPVLSEGSCAMTSNEDITWFMVDLGDVYTIYSVSLTNRDTGGTSHFDRRLRFFTIIGFADTVNTADFSQHNPQLCSDKYKTSDGFPAATTEKFNCEITVRYVVVNKTEEANTNLWWKILALCEVEVEAACKPGVYNNKCPAPCSINCAGICDILDGTCTLCKDGYVGATCDRRTEGLNVNLTYQTPYANNEIVAGSRVTLVCLWTESMNVSDSFGLSFKQGETYSTVYTAKTVANQDEYGFVGNLFGRATLHDTTANQYSVTITEFKDTDQGDYKCFVVDYFLDTAESIQTLTLSFTGRFNAALNKSTEQSSTNYYERDSRVSSRAVDGNRNPVVSEGSCAETRDEASTWFMVDLEAVYTIYSVSLTNRDATSENFQRRLRRFTIIGFADEVNTTDFSQHNPQLCSDKYKTSGNVPAETTEKFTCEITARYIVVNKTEEAETNFWWKILTLCEVEVEAACRPGFYNNMCPAPCSINCAGTCDILDGTCTLCKDGSFGATCNNECSANCVNSTCMKNNGSCDENGCSDGYYGDMCEQDCPENCNNTACVRENGFCGASGCNSGFYGDKCDGDCPENCNNNTACVRENGFCDASGCKRGFYGDKCDGEMDESEPSGTNAPDDEIGAASTTLAEGLGKSSGQESSGAEDQQNISLWVILGLIVFGLLVLILVIITVIMFRKRAKEEEIEGTPRATTDSPSDSKGSIATDDDTITELPFSQEASSVSKATADSVSVESQDSDFTLNSVPLITVIP